MTEPVPGLDDLAAMLAGAWERAEAVPAPSRLRPETDLEDAYRIQEMVVGQRMAAGRRMAGWKMGLTSSPDSQPIVGTLLDDMVVPSGVVLDPAGMVAPLVEAELVFVVGETIPAGSGIDDIARGDHRVAAGLEVIDYRTVDSDGVVDWVADNSTVAYAVMGEPRALAEVAPLTSIGVELFSGAESLATGAGSLVMGEPLRAIAWLADHLAGRGLVLEAGAVVLTGSLTGHHRVTPGLVYRASFDRLGEVTATFTT
jgi:2-keto-4-pentenoate hydratase